MKLLLGTANTGKSMEMQSIVRPFISECVLPAALGITGQPSEPFTTLRENALFKAQFYHERGNAIPTIAEDTGLYVEALSQELGVKTRRWGAGENATDDAWLAHFLRRMEREQNRRAMFQCVVAYIDDHGNASFFEGACSGTITREPRAPFLRGLPVSSVFLPDRYDTVFSALTEQEKNHISHRGKALTQFLTFIQTK